MGGICPSLGQAGLRALLLQCVLRTRNRGAVEIEFDDQRDSHASLPKNQTLSQKRPDRTLSRKSCTLVGIKG